MIYENRDKIAFEAKKPICHSSNRLFMFKN
jgi:hypothetical protein